MDLLIPTWHAMPDKVGALSTLRSGGSSLAPYDDSSGKGGFNLGLHVGDDPDYVLRNRLLLKSYLPAEPAWLTQVHGNTVVEASQVQGVPLADASFTTQSGVVCAILTADCMPVLLCDRSGSVVAAAHAGWRGLAGGVLENTVKAMRQAGGMDLMAWVGPAIGPQQFEVGEDVRVAFAHLGAEAAQAFTAIENLPRNLPNKYLANLPLLAQLILARVAVHHVTGCNACTVSEPARFYSYRRDGITGRMASMIWLD